MSAVTALLLAVSLAAASTAPPDPDTVVSPLDVPGHANKVVMHKPDRNGDKVICKNETVPDSRLTQRTCARRRDREAVAAEHRQLITDKQHRCDIVGAC
jgi:hypothetical protein